MLTEDRGALRRDSPRGSTSCGVDVEEAAGRDPPKKALLGLGGVNVDGGRGVVVYVDGGGDSRPSGTMTREESTINKTPRISQLAGSYCLAVALCPLAALLLCLCCFCLAVALSLLGRCCLVLPCCVRGVTVPCHDTYTYIRGHHVCVAPCFFCYYS